MPTIDEIKAIVVSLVNRWLFPDFHNKVTWTVIGIGASVVATPIPLKLAFYNWLIESYNLNAGKTLELAQIGPSSADYWLGFGLIFSALLHNTLSKWVLNQNSIQAQSAIQSRINEVDEALFVDFLKIFPSGSKSAHLLENHNFEHTFSLKSLQNIDDFVNDWNRPERQFMNPELEILRKELWVACHEFSTLIALKSSPTHGGRQSVVPDHHADAWSYPDWLKNDIETLNDMASKVFELHQDFITSVRNALKC